MPLFAGWIGVLIGTLWSVIQAYLIARVAFRVAAVATLYLAWAELKDITDSAMAVAFSSMPPILSIPLTWIMPPQMPAIITMIATVESGLLAYRWAKILFGVKTE